MKATDSEYAAIFRLAKRLSSTVDYVDTNGLHEGMLVSQVNRGGAYTTYPDGRVYCPLFADLAWVRLGYPAE